MQDKDIPEVQKKIVFCFRVMSRSFADPIKAEESFQILDQLKDANIWKILTNLVDPNTSLHQSRAYRVKLPVANRYAIGGTYLGNHGYKLYVNSAPIYEDMRAKTLNSMLNSCDIYPLLTCHEFG